jgi:hypothetical protein
MMRPRNTPVDPIPRIPRSGGKESPPDHALDATLLRLNGRPCGVAVGLALGLGIFIATNVLVLKGGPVVGPHLGLLGVYLPGYSVTFGGSLIGFVYMFVIGYGVGRLVGEVYNRYAGLGS